MTREVNRKDIAQKYHCLHHSFPIHWKCCACGRLTQKPEPSTSWKNILPKQNNKQESNRVAIQQRSFWKDSHCFKAVCSPEDFFKRTLIPKKALTWRVRYLFPQKHQPQHRSRGNMKKGIITDQNIPNSLVTSSPVIEVDAMQNGEFKRMVKKSINSKEVRKNN